MMTHSDYRDALARLDLTQVGAARLLGLNPRTSRYYASTDPSAELAHPIPRLVEVALTAMIEVAALKKKLARKERT